MGTCMQVPSKNGKEDTFMWGKEVGRDVVKKKKKKTNSPLLFIG